MTIDATHVPLRTGPPTKEEMDVYYPGKFTWNELKTFINSGDLGLLKRDKALQKRYDEWSVGIKQEHGSMDYLLNYRLQWGKPDTLSLLRSALNYQEISVPPVLTDSPRYFTSSTPSNLISIIQNDWPYSVPSDIEHTLIWTRVPIFCPDIVDSCIAARINHDGIWGFTGNTSPPPSPSTLPKCLPALSDWGVTLDKMMISEKGSHEEELLVARAGAEVQEFVKTRWKESEWETAWFVNPPRLQSIPGLAHIHVFARHKA